MKTLVTLADTLMVLSMQQVALACLIIVVGFCDNFERYLGIPVNHVSYLRCEIIRDISQPHAAPRRGNKKRSAAPEKGNRK